MKNNLLWSWLTPLSLILFIGSFFVLAFKINVVFALSISVSLHELGHLVMNKRYGFASRVLFIPFLGAVVIPIETKEYLTLAKSKRALVAIVGPIVNIVLALLSYILFRFGVFPEFFMFMYQLNFVLVAVNIAPIAIFDGDRIYTALCEGLAPGLGKTILSVYAGILAFIALSLIFFGVNTLLEYLQDLNFWTLTTLVFISYISISVFRSGAFPNKQNLVLFTSEKKVLSVITTLFLTLSSTTIVLLIQIFNGFKLVIQ